MTTEETKHTPGPWHWDTVRLPGIAPTTGDPHPRVWPLNASGGECVVRHRAPWAVRDANARLIAAAPDLLAACEAAAAFWEGTDAPTGALCRAAIARAKGEQP